jgi:hypothetical protein
VLYDSCNKIPPFVCLSFVSISQDLLWAREMFLTGDGNVFSYVTAATVSAGVVLILKLP